MFREELQVEAVAHNPVRIGKPREEKDPLLRVTFNTRKERAEVLRKATMLRTSKHAVYKNVYIKPDLTRKERAEAKNLYNQL
jgi:hypothetical protein